MSNESAYFNKKFSPLEIALAIDRLGFVGLVEREGISPLNKFFYKGRISNFVRYPATSIDGAVQSKRYGTVFSSTEEPRVPAEVKDEARSFYAKNNEAQKTFLMHIYDEIVRRTEPAMQGNYGRRFHAREGDISATINFFADMMPEHDMKREAAELDLRVKEQFPLEDPIRNQERDALKRLDSLLPKESRQALLRYNLRRWKWHFTD